MLFRHFMAWNSLMGSAANQTPTKTRVSQSAVAFASLPLTSILLGITQPASLFFARTMATEHGDQNFSSKTLAVRIQKKVLGKLASRNTAKHFISETTSRLLDGVYRILKDYYSKKEAEKVIKCMIKIVIKIGVLQKGDHLSRAEEQKLQNFVRKFRSLILTVISFVQVDFSYDRQFLKGQLTESRAMLQEIIAPHLSDKSSLRVEKIFTHFGKDEFMDTVFRSDSVYKDTTKQIAADLNSLIEEGEL